MKDAHELQPGDKVVVNPGDENPMIREVAEVEVVMSEPRDPWAKPLIDYTEVLFTDGHAQRSLFYVLLEDYEPPQFLRRRFGGDYDGGIEIVCTKCGCSAGKAYRSNGGMIERIREIPHLHNCK